MSARVYLMKRVKDVVIQNGLGIPQKLRIYIDIYIEHAASALYNGSKQKGTAVHQEPKFIFVQVSAAHNIHSFINKINLTKI